MMVTGTDIIKGALADFLGITNYSTEDAMLAFRSLNDLVPVIESAYKLGIKSISGISDEMDIPDYAIAYVKMKLGASVAGSFGKSLSVENHNALRYAQSAIVSNLDLSIKPNVLTPVGIASL